MDSSTPKLPQQSEEFTFQQSHTLRSKTSHKTDNISEASFKNSEASKPSRRKVKKRDNTAIKPKAETLSLKEASEPTYRSHCEREE
jgi:hypothetical protein